MAEWTSMSVRTRPAPRVHKGAWGRGRTKARGTGVHVGCTSPERAARVAAAAAAAPRLLTKMLFTWEWERGWTCSNCHLMGPYRTLITPDHLLIDLMCPNRPLNGANPPLTHPSAPDPERTFVAARLLHHGQPTSLIPNKRIVLSVRHHLPWL